MEKRLLCIISSLNTGGAETFLMKVYRSLDRSKYRMDFVVSDDGFYDEEVLELGGKIYHVPLRTAHPFKVFGAIRRIVKENQYHSVLKLGNSPLCVTDLIAAKMGGAEICAMRSCNAPTNLSFKQKATDFVFRPILNGVANVKLAPSDLAACYTFGEKRSRRGEVQFLHNGVDLGVFCYDDMARERIREEFSLVGKTVIGHVGRFNKQKNHKFLLSVFSEIKKKDENAKLLLVGTGELEESIRAQASELGVLEDIVFTGVRRDVPALLSAMDVFVFPSKYEGLGVVLVEAQTNGLYCFASARIPQECKISNRIEFLSIEDATLWAENILDNGTQVERATCWEEIADTRFDIKSSAKKLQAYYLGDKND